MEEKYEDRAAVKAVIEDLGLFPAWEAGKLRPDLMPNPTLGLLAEVIDIGFEAAANFLPQFRAELGLRPEGDYIKDVNQ